MNVALWQSRSVRDEIRPDFAAAPEGGRDGAGTLLITMDSRPGLKGYWERTFPVAGGEWVRFSAWRRAGAVANPRRSCLVELNWQDDAGQPVPEDRPIVERYLRHWANPNAESEHPRDGQTDAAGWTEVSGTYRVPPQATQARVTLYLQWAPGGQVEWSEVSLQPTAAPAPRTVKLAAAHHRPDSGGTPLDNCRTYEPLIAEAGRQGVDLLVLGEVVPSVGQGASKEAVAETVPGPATDYFASQAQAHHLHLVFSLYEREAHVIYNTAVLLSPEGAVLGRYRKVCLPRGEGEGGAAPGEDYPVFDTAFGRVGMMICYDGFFPEVSRELANRGAEVIAWPVWGCNPDLAVARALDNQIYIVSSTYEGIENNWMKSAVWGPDGSTVALATEWGTLAVAEVDLDQPTQWRCLGNFRDQVPRHRP